MGPKQSEKMQKPLDSVYLLGSVRELKKLKSSQRISTRLNNDAGRLTLVLNRDLQPKSLRKVYLLYNRP